MNPPQSFDGPTSGIAPGSRYRTIRANIQQMDADELARRLPGLVESVVSNSRDSPEGLQFELGVSFTKREVPFDYRMDRLVHEGRNEPRAESVKPPISHDHYYLTFRYPPDPNFTADSLRGALLVAIESSLDRRDMTRLNPPSPSDVTDEPEDGRITSILKTLRSR